MLVFQSVGWLFCQFVEWLVKVLSWIVMVKSFRWWLVGWLAFFLSHGETGHVLRKILVMTMIDIYSLFLGGCNLANIILCHFFNNVRKLSIHPSL